MINILSIDWDYFMTRTLGVDQYIQDTVALNIDEFDREVASPEHYLRWHRALTNGTCRNLKFKDKEFSILKHILDDLNPGTDVVVHEDHHAILDTTWRSAHYVSRRHNEKIVLYNVDFHHDYYSILPEYAPLNCGNWLQKAVIQDSIGMNNRGEVFLKPIKQLEDIYWISGRKGRGQRPVEKVKMLPNISDIKDVKFGYVFICKSSEYMSPMYDDKFLELIDILRSKCLIREETDVLYNLKKSVLVNRKEKMKELFDNAKSVFN